MPAKLSVLKTNVLFGDLPQNQLKALGNIAVVQDFNRGQIVFADGEEGTGFFMVVSGQVKVSKLSSEGKEQILHIVGPGESLGVVPVFSGRSFPANAQALAESQLFFFPKNAFVDLIAENPSMAMNMIAVLSKRLRDFTVQVENLSLKEVPARLASYLLYAAHEQNDHNRVVLNISKGQLASLIGTVPETLSRILGRLASQGLIKIDGRSIVLLDRTALAGLATYEKRMK